MIIPPTIPFWYLRLSFPFQTLHIDLSLIANSDCQNFCTTKIMYPFLLFIDPPLIYINPPIPWINSWPYFLTFKSRHLNSSAPPHKKLVREKLPNYILGLAMSRLLKWWEHLLYIQWWSGDPRTCSSYSSLKY